MLNKTAVVTAPGSASPQATSVAGCRLVDFEDHVQASLAVCWRNSGEAVEFQPEMSALSPALRKAAERVIRSAKSQGRSVATVESCAAGALAGLLAEAEGAGDAIHGGVVVYSKAAKSAAIGVPRQLIERHTAVSREVALAMARGGLECFPADVVVAVTGVAGPFPDEDGNPVGLVHIAAVSRKGGELHVERQFGQRSKDDILQETIGASLSLLLELVAA
jgi:nicotinamide-nucleotide amidase